MSAPVDSSVNINTASAESIGVAKLAAVPKPAPSNEPLGTVSCCPELKRELLQLIRSLSRYEEEQIPSESVPVYEIHV
jgi:hypothetical protein